MTRNGYDEATLAVDLPEAVVLPYEWITGTRNHRRFSVAAAVVNEHGRISSWEAAHSTHRDQSVHAIVITGTRRVLPGGGTAVVLVWVTLPSDRVPTSLTHRFTVQFANPVASSPNPSPPVSDGQELTIISGVSVAEAAVSPRVIGPPLQGDHWLAANGPDNGCGHRQALMALAGEGRIAQRFAIDWVRLYDDGRTSQGDSSRNVSYRAYGAAVLAVADGTVSETHDRIPENDPDPVARAVPMTPETIGDNYVLLDIGEGAYAFYAHPQPGSLKVRKGDRVQRGQVLALVGNTGNSTEPHLHFHVAERKTPFDTEGIPYAFESFDLEALSE